MVFPWFSHGIPMVFPPNCACLPAPSRACANRRCKSSYALNAGDKNAPSRKVPTETWWGWAYHKVVPPNDTLWYWLVVWNMFYFSIYWEQPSQLTFIFFRGVETTNQGKRAHNHGKSPRIVGKSMISMDSMGHVQQRTVSLPEDKYRYIIMIQYEHYYMILGLYDHYLKIM